jgi:acyl-CoA reductase-like NAD-dependent aldehyde dehydrogenase
MVIRLRVKRGWDRACEKAEIAFGAVGVLQGQSVRLSSVEMSLSHLLTLTFTPSTEAGSQLVKYWLKAMIRDHR